MLAAVRRVREMEQEQDKLIDSIIELRQKMEEQERTGWNLVDAFDQMEAEVNDLVAANQDAAATVPPLLEGFDNLVTRTDDLNANLQSLGITSETDLRKVRDNAIAARDAILGSDLATDYEKKSAIYKALKAQVEYAERVGQEVPEKQKQLLKDLKAQLEGPDGLSQVEAPWDNMITNISTSLTNGVQKMVGILLGTEPGSLKDAFKQLGSGLLSSIVENGVSAVQQFVNQAVADLLKKGPGSLFDAFSQIGRWIKGLFSGGGGGAVGAVSGAVSGGGGVAGAAGGGGAGGAISGALGGGPLGWANLGVTVANGIVAGFQRARQETTLNAIEENTRRGTQYLGDRADGGIMTASLKSLEQLGYEVANTDNIKTSLWNLESVFTSTGSLLMTRLNNIRAATETSASKLDDMKLGIDGTNLSLGILHQDLFALGTYLYQMDTNLGFQVASTDSIKEALWGIKEYAFAVAGNINPIKELLGQIRDARSITVNVNAQTNASPEEIADAIASTLRTQGVVA